MISFSTGALRVRDDTAPALQWIWVDLAAPGSGTGERVAVASEARRAHDRPIPGPLLSGTRPGQVPHRLPAS